MNKHPEYEGWMRLALSLAEKGRGETSPNPLVGAVIVKDGNLIGVGYHRGLGLPHAEAEALHAAGSSAQGATLVVNLEPCNHDGRTPPCTEAIIQSRIARVVTGLSDPNREVKGGGHEVLLHAGIEVIEGVLEEECSHLNRVFFKYVTQRLPWVTLKIAQTLDAKIALPLPLSLRERERVRGRVQISGEASRVYAHELRAEHDAILVGVGTLLSDDPELTIRYAAPRGKPLLRLVLDSTLRSPVEAKIFQQTDQYLTWIATTDRSDPSKRKAFQNRGAKVILCSKDSSERVALADLLSKLSDHEIAALLVEGGAAVHTAFLQQGFADEYIAILSPALFGEGGLSSLCDTLPHPLRFARSHWNILSPDAVFRGTIAK
ncbi:MAG: bifunctional diaminohydroxyphosphoribosylaminopyrimidine deaminase/5-amino-6-(5-phosphoribosylamino)uracil reductase RibD [Deltaproteobacteria bacterium]|nr:bifunctional diaminohydroxyphosphoribosylaminopyrimidine deaminase/5-amino-6-(5-phosphoribosylamino)uracil reductase RibD [Deltaproteobacteria bacterium]